MITCMATQLDADQLAALLRTDDTVLTVRIWVPAN